MILAWTHTPCGTGNPTPHVDECKGCGLTPTAIAEVVQHETPRVPGPAWRDLPAQRDAHLSDRAHRIDRAGLDLTDLQESTR